MVNQKRAEAKAALLLGLAELGNTRPQGLQATITTVDGLEQVFN